MNEEVLDDRSIAALAGLMVIQSGGEFRIPAYLVESGLPEDSNLRVNFDVQEDELVLTVEKNE